MQRLHAPDIFFGSQRALRVERVGGVGVGECFAQPHGRLGCEGRERDAEAPAGVYHQRLERARIGHDADIAAARPLHAIEIDGGLDHVFERVDADDSRRRSANASNTSVLPASDPVWANAALRASSDPPALTTTMLLPLRRAFGGGEKAPARIDDGFDVAGDDAQIGIVGEIIDVVREGEPGLVAAGNQIGEGQSRIDETAAERLRQHSALGQRGDTARHQGLDLLIGKGAETSNGRRPAPCSSGRPRRCRRS